MSELLISKLLISERLSSLVLTSELVILEVVKLATFLASDFYKFFATPNSLSLGIFSTKLPLMGGKYYGRN